jgi:transcriptional regulator with XRE-family HTH domain
MKKNTSLIAIGERIRQKRMAMKIRQKEMAEKLGITGAYLSEIENGKGNPGTDFFVKLATLYNIDLHYLLLGDEKMPERTMITPDIADVDFSDGLESMDQLVWLAEASTYVKNFALSMMSKFVIENAETIRLILEKKKKADHSG